MNGPSPLYAATGGPAAHAPRLLGTVAVETAIIGAGFTGLSAALHLAELGRTVAVLDTQEPGWGASGRNGGQVNPGLKPDPDQVAADCGERLVQVAWDAPDLVFALIERHDIACEAVRGGTLRAAADPLDLPGLQQLAAQCGSRGMPIRLLGADEIAARSGSRHYLAALLDERGGQVNPLAYARGLARAASGLGARIFSQSPALLLERSGAGWRITTPHGAVQADQVVVATNGYTGPLVPKLARSIVPVFSAIIASRPLPAASRARILARREVLYELGGVTTYYRIDQAGRLLIGGRSQSRPLAGAIEFAFLARHAAGLWPELARIGWEHGWNGQLAMTTDHYPHWHEPQAGLFACLGYNGRGVAMATVLGRELARRVAGQPDAEMLLPPRPIRPISLHAAWPVAVSARLLAGRLRDARSGWR